MHDPPPLDGIVPPTGSSSLPALSWRGPLRGPGQTTPSPFIQPAGRVTWSTLSRHSRQVLPFPGVSWGWVQESESQGLCRIPQAPCWALSNALGCLSHLGRQHPLVKTDSRGRRSEEGKRRSEGKNSKKRNQGRGRKKRN